MRTFLITAALAATIPGSMALAQPAGQTDQTTVQTTVTPTAPTNVIPPAPSSVPPVPSASPPAASGSGSVDAGSNLSGSNGLQFSPSQEIVESAPPAPQSYPMCTRTLQDSCKNPNPAKELPYYRPKS